MQNSVYFYQEVDRVFGRLVGSRVLALSIAGFWGKGHIRAIYLFFVLEQTPNTE